MPALSLGVPKAGAACGVAGDMIASTSSRHRLSSNAAASAAFSRSPFFNPANRGWLEDLEREGFRQVVAWSPRIWRWRYVEDLLIFPTLEAQGHELGKWVVSAFRDLCATQPPG